MATFVKRTTAPDSSDFHYYSENPFYLSGWGMPNCTAYAWGRFYELSGVRPALSLGNAEDWYNFSDGYARGIIPKLGAVACWRRGETGNDNDGAGHVAIVEQINADGSIMTSESGYDAYLFETFTRANDGNWGQSSAYTFQGFIYNPVDFGSGSFTPPDPISENRYLTMEEMQINATYIYWYLSSRGWTLNAIAGMLGNFQTESTINPGLWQNMAVNVGPAFGLAQWDPYTKYTNWCANNGLDPADMDSALMRIEWELENGGQYDPTPGYPETFAEFKVSTKDPYYLGMAFLLNYERPANQNQPARGEQAEYWYTYLSGININPGYSKRKKKKYNFVLFGRRAWRNHQ